MYKHKRRIRGESSGGTQSQEKFIMRSNSFESADDVFYTTQSHGESEFQKRKKITKSQMRGMIIIKKISIIIIM